MLVVLSQLVGPGHHLPLSDPLLQVINLPIQLEETQTLIQLPPTLLWQILQTGVQFIHLWLTHPDTLTEQRVKGEKLGTPFFLFKVSLFHLTKFHIYFCGLIPSFLRVWNKTETSSCLFDFWFITPLCTSPVWVSSSYQSTAGAWQLMDSICIILHRLLQDLVLLQHGHWTLLVLSNTQIFIRSMNAKYTFSFSFFLFY